MRRREEKRRARAMQELRERLKGMQEMGERFRRGSLSCSYCRQLVDVVECDACAGSGRAGVPVTGSDWRPECDTCEGQGVVGRCSRDDRHFKLLRSGCPCRGTGVVRIGEYQRPLFDPNPFINRSMQVRATSRQNPQFLEAPCPFCDGYGRRYRITIGRAPSRYTRS